MAIKGGSHGEKKSHSSSKDKNKQPPTKVVIRRLPPDMASDTFTEQVSPLPDHDYLCFVPADPGLGSHAFSRAYINFLNMDDILTFRDRFDGYVFVDKQGFEYPAVVEFAPYQRTPRRRSRKPDAKSGTILEDADYKAFLAACEQNEAQSAAPSWEQTLEEIEKRHSELKEANVVTPLVTYVCKKRAEKKEERRRRELERRKEETRKAREKLLAKEKRDAKEKVRYDSKESAKTLREEEKDRKRDDGPATKKYDKYDDKQKDKYAKEYTRDKYAKEISSKGDKEDKYKRKDRDERRKDDGRERSSHKDDRWKEEPREKPRREEKTRTFSREERRKDTDWEDKKKRTERKSRTSESGSEAAAAASTKESRDPAAEAVRDDGSERSAETRAGGDAAASSSAKPTSGKRESPSARKERKDSKAERGKTGLKNKDRPSLTIYRPGMGKYSSRRLRERDSESPADGAAAGGGGSGGEEAPEDHQPPQRDTKEPRSTGPPPRTRVFRRSRTAAE